MRPHVLLFNDPYYMFDKYYQSYELFDKFIWDKIYLDKKVTILEIGAGTTI